MPDKKAIQRLKRIERTARAELVLRIKDAQTELAGKITNLQPRKYPLWHKAVRENYYGRIASHYELLGKELDAWGKSLTNKTARIFHAAAITDIKNLAGGNIRANVTRFSPQRVERYWSIVHPNNARHLAAVFTDKMAAGDIQALRSAYIETTRQSALESWTQNEFHKKLQTAWNEKAANLASDKFIDAAGRPWRDDVYIEMLTRTMTARIARESYVDTLINNGDDLARIGPSGDSCDICRRWLGVIISLSGANENYPSYEEALDAGWGHPRCDCLLSRMDETIHADDIESQGDIDNPGDWTDPEEMDAYREAAGL